MTRDLTIVYIALDTVRRVSTATVLIVDTDAEESVTIEDGVRLAGHRAVCVADLAQGLELSRSTHPDLVIVSTADGSIDEIEVCKAMKSVNPELPVILVTSGDNDGDVVRGLSAGADDCVRHPLNLEELLLRMNVVLRRCRHDGADTLTCGPIVMDISSARVDVHGHGVALSRTEYRLLEFLLRNKNRVVTREEILRDVWSIDFATETTVVETFVSYLRRKLGAAAALLQTVRGVGFKLVEEFDDAPPR